MKIKKILLGIVISMLLISLASAYESSDILPCYTFADADTSGVITIDSNDKFNGTFAFMTTGIQGFQDEAYDFATDNRANIILDDTNNMLLEHSTGFTILFRANFTSTISSNINLMGASGDSMSGGTFNSFFVGLYTTNKLRITIPKDGCNDGSSDISDYENIPIGSWNEFAIVYNGSTSTMNEGARLYINGVDQISIQSFGGTPASIEECGKDFIIGQTDAGDSSADMHLDNFMIINATLNTDEINAIQVPALSCEQLTNMPDGKPVLNISSPFITNLNHTISVTNVTGDGLGYFVFRNSTLIHALNVSVFDTNFSESGVFEYFVIPFTGAGNGTQSDNYLIIFDIDKPTITVNDLSGITYTDKPEINFSVDYVDNNGLFTALWNITYALNDSLVIENVSFNISGNPLSITLNGVVPSSSLPDGLYTFFGYSADYHTKKKIKDYNINKNIENKELSFIDDNKIISVVLESSTNSLIEFYTTKKTDRYTLHYRFDNKDKYTFYTYEFLLVSSHDIIYLPNSDYRGHFITSNKWIDFEIPDNQATYNIQRVNNKAFRITIITKLDTLDFNSLGELNIETETFNFILETSAVVNDTNVTGIGAFNFDECPDTTESLVIFGMVLLIGLWLVYLAFKTNYGIIGILGGIIIIGGGAVIINCNDGLGLILVIAGIVLTAISGFALKIVR